jgi:hypothetical protein
MSLHRSAAASRFSLALLGALAIAGAANAQTASASSANAKLANLQNQSADVPVRDPDGAAVILDGQIQTGADESTFGSGSAGSVDMVAGVSAGGGATVIGSNLQLVAPASYDTVAANSDQSHPGPIGAGTTH